MSLAVVFNGRRKTVKVTPNTTMQAVLEVRSHGLDFGTASPLLTKLHLLHTDGLRGA